MKSILNTSRIVLTALVVAAVHSVNAAAPVSPTLTNAAGWDCLISGPNKEQGILFLTFNPDNTLEGAMVRARVGVPKASADRSGRPSDRAPSTPPATSITNAFGFTEFHNGLWWFDASGYTVGIFGLVSISESSETNVTQFSFKAKIASNKRITASYSTSLNGNGTFRGVPIKTTLPDLSGGWAGTERNGKLTTYEWFTMFPAGNWPNVYTITNGYGPGYGFWGNCMVSSQKKIGFGTIRPQITTTETNELERATIGSFINKSTSLGGKTKGIFNFGTNVISYDAFRVIAPIPD